MKDREDKDENRKGKEKKEWKKGRKESEGEVRREMDGRQRRRIGRIGIEGKIS